MHLVCNETVCCPTPVVDASSSSSLKSRPVGATVQPRLQNPEKSIIGEKKCDASLLLVAAHCEAANCFDLCQFPPFLMLNRVVASHIRFGSGRGGCPLFYNEQSIPAPSLMPPNAFCYAVSMQTSAQVYSALLQVLGSEWI